jgi:ferric-dicitrate binding protein FerR (iron transport regulator)
LKKLLFLFLIISLSSPLWADIMVDRIQGNVEVMLPGASSWSKTEKGAVLPGDCRISTGFNSSAILLINGETTVTLKALSRLTVEEATKQSSGAQNTRLFLGSGRIRADVKKSQGSIHDFKVRTPVATAAVRGTKFDMSSGTLEVTEGTVRFTVGSYSFSVKQGQSTKIQIINGRTGLVSPVTAALSICKVQSNTGTDGGEVGDSITTTGRSGYAAIELR